MLPLLLTEWDTSSPLLYVLSLIVIVAVVSAIMSTVDSMLLSLSPMLAKDVLATTVLRGADEARLTRAGELMSWALVAGPVGIALNPRIASPGLGLAVGQANIAAFRAFDGAWTAQAPRVHRTPLYDSLADWESIPDLQGLIPEPPSVPSIPTTGLIRLASQEA